MNAGSQVRLTHSTAQIADEFERDWGLSFPVLEHPSTTFSDKEARALAIQPISDAARAPKQRFRVVFPGGARVEKGFSLSISAIDLLRGDGQFELALRSRLDKVSGPKLHRAFAELDKTGIEILDQDLSDAQFIQMIGEADIIVIPYEVGAFRRRTSGILIDSMLLGKPIVVLEGTWLADIVDAEGIGVSVPGTPEGLVAGIRDIATRYDSFAHNIEQARHAYLEKNSWTSLVKSLAWTIGAPLGQADQIGNVAGRELLSQLAERQSDEDRSLLLKVCAAMLLLDTDATDRAITSDAKLGHAISEALERLQSGDRTCTHFTQVRRFVASNRLSNSAEATLNNASELQGQISR